MHFTRVNIHDIYMYGQLTIKDLINPYSRENIPKGNVLLVLSSAQRQDVTSVRLSRREIKTSFVLSFSYLHLSTRLCQVAPLSSVCSVKDGPHVGKVPSQAPLATFYTTDAESYIYCNDCHLDKQLQIGFSFCFYIPFSCGFGRLVLGHFMSRSWDQYFTI